MRGFFYSVVELAAAAAVSDAPLSDPWLAFERVAAA
jgi:hypothetical protein